MSERTFWRVDIAQAKQLLNRDGIMVLDVRDANSYHAAHIASARNANRDTVDMLLLGTPKDTPVLIYCYHGISSQTYAQMFADFGFREAYSLDGGYEGWRAAEATA